MRFALVLWCLLCLGHVSIAQVADVAPALTESDIQQHLLQHKEPTYPALAKAAGIHGDVEITVIVNDTGHVVSEKVVSGPAMLREAALDAVREWQFTPFLKDGKPIQVVITLTVPFYVGKRDSGPTKAQEKAAQAWFPLSNKCRSSLNTHNAKDSLKYCKQALDKSLNAGDLRPSDQLAMLSSYEEYGHALLENGKLQKALVAENKAIDIAKVRLKNTDQEYAMPFYWRAAVEEKLGQEDAASADFSIAEETHRRAIAHLPEAKEMYSRYLANILRQHAALLDQMGRPGDAEKLRIEAASL